MLVCKCSEGNNISLVRGDTYATEIEIYEGEEQYTPSPSDTLTVEIWRNLKTPDGMRFVDADPALSVVVPISTMTLRLTSEQTAALTFGNYVYKARLRHSGDTDTVIQGATLTALP